MTATETVYPASIFSLTDHEIYLVTAQNEGQDGGQIATWVMPATLVPDHPRMTILLSPMNFTQGLIAGSGRFVVHLLSEEQHELLPLFGLYSMRDRDKFADISFERGEHGIPLLPGSCGWAVCHVVASLDLGDRILYVADIESQEVATNRRPLRKREAFALQPPELRRLLEEKHRVDGLRDRTLIKHITH
ncbi:MAG: flavin reductase [Bacteroidetes bacterium]|nr:flavin reductase [Bacteroidota bacterium]